MRWPFLRKVAARSPATAPTSSAQFERNAFIMFALALRLQLAPKAADRYAAKTVQIVYRTGWDAFLSSSPAPALLASEPLLHDLCLEG